MLLLSLCSWDNPLPQAEPIVEHHADFPTPCWDTAFLNHLCAPGRLERASRSAEVVHQQIRTAIARCAGAEHFVHFCSLPVPIDGYLVRVVLQLRKSAYEAVPRLVDFPQPFHHHGPFSLVDHAISTYLADCPGELQNPATDPHPRVETVPRDSARCWLGSRSPGGLSLLFDGDSIYGAGTVTPGYDGEAKNIFTIQFTQPGTWEVVAPCATLAGR